MKLLKPAVFCKMFIFFLAFFLLGACNDPIFFLISEEIPLIPPLIKGSPTNFVLFEDKNEDDELEKYIFVASGRNIFRYKDGFWEENYLKLDYRIGQLAATKDYLYVLCLRDTGSAVTIKLLRYDRAEWKEITNTCNDYTVIQTIFSPNLDDNKLYIGAHKSSRTDGVLEYAILFVDGGEDEIKPTGITGIRALLNGVASNGSDTFFSTRNGIYLAGGSTTPIPTFPATDDNDNPTTITNFSRIIKLPDNNVVALTQSGNVHQFSAANIVRTPVASFPENRGDATGSFAIWQEKDDPSRNMLLAGRRDRRYTISTGHTNGYVELKLDENGGIEEGNSFVTPGTRDVEFSTVVSNSPFINTIGAIPVNHIIQAPDGRLFASTQNKGVWAYRLRDGDTVYTWNAENNDR